MAGGVSPNFPDARKQREEAATSARNRRDTTRDRNRTKSTEHVLHFAGSAHPRGMLFRGGRDHPPRRSSVMGFLRDYLISSSSIPLENGIPGRTFLK